MSEWLSLQAITKMLSVGGWQMPALVFIGAWSGYLLVKRTLELLLASAAFQRLQSSPDSWEGQASREWHLMQLKMILKRTPVLRQTVIASAPLMGLLGTVAGMITTFSSLSDGIWVQASGGIAGGISQALLTTQLGLVIALPGILWQRLLQQRAQRMLLRWETLEQKGGGS